MDRDALNQLIDTKGTSEREAYHEGHSKGYAEGYRDGRITALRLVVSTFFPDNGISSALTELERQIKERR